MITVFNELWISHRIVPIFVIWVHLFFQFQGRKRTEYAKNITKTIKNKNIGKRKQNGINV